MDWLANLFNASNGSGPFGGMGGQNPMVGGGAQPPNPAAAAMGGAAATPGAAGGMPGLLGGIGNNPQAGNALFQQAMKMLQPQQMKPASFSPLQIGTGRMPGQGPMGV